MEEKPVPSILRLSQDPGRQRGFYFGVVAVVNGSQSMSVAQNLVSHYICETCILVMKISHSFDGTGREGMHA